MTLPYKKALITGATSGLGEALSHLLAKEGLSLLLVGRNQEALTRIKQALSSAVDVKIYSLDLSQKEPLNQLLSVIDQEAPDLIINNAGFGIYGDALSTKLEEQESLLDLNIKALTLISITGAKALKAKKTPGCIVQISSAAAFFPYPAFASYSASKGYVNQFSKALAYELKGDSIDVLISCPGQFTSRFRERASHGQFSSSSFGTMSTSSVAQAVLKQIKSKKCIKIINWKYSVSVFFAVLLQHTNLLMKILKKEIDKRV